MNVRTAVWVVGTVMLAWSARVPAATLYWSGSGTTQGGSGTWGTTLTTFGTAAAGPYDVVWDTAANAGDTVTFGGLSGTVTLDTEITARLLTLNNATTLTGASLVSNGTSGLSVSIGGGANRAVGGTIASTITGTAGLSVSGSRGPLVLAAANTFSGQAAIGGGSTAGTTAVQLEDPAAIPASANLNLKNGVAILTAASGNLSRALGTAANHVQINGGGGFAASGGDRTVTLGASTISWSGTSAFAKTSAFIMGHSTADSTITLTNALNLSGGGRFIRVDDGSATVDAVLAGQVGVASGSNGSLSKSGAGTLALTANNLLIGSVTVSDGKLQLGKSGTTGALPQASGVSVAANGTFAIDRVNTVTQGVNFPTISGAGAFAHTGTGTTTLTAANTYSGRTSVTAGVLRLGVGGSIAASSVVEVGAGGVFDVTAVGTYAVPATQTLAGSGTIAGAVTTGSGGTLAPGAGPGTLTFDGGLTLGGAGDYNWQLLSATGTAGAAEAWDLVNVTGAITIDATSVDPFRVNLWTLSGAVPEVSGSAANFDPANDYAWTIATAAGGISGFAADKFSIVTTATNGTGGFANALLGGSFSIAQSGNNLNLVFTRGAGPAGITIDVASGTQTQAAAGYPTLTGTLPLLKTGAGTLVLDQANSISGSTTIQGGVVALATPQGLAFSSVVPLAGGTLSLSPYAVTTVTGLAANAGGLTDVGNGSMTVLSGLSAVDLVTALVAGRNGGSWDGTTGITSGSAAAASASSIPRAVGWLDNGDGSVSFAYAAPGDTNIDWSIDILDASNFLAGGKFDTALPATWIEGDFSYDGIVDILDAADFFATGLYDAGTYNTAPGSAAGVAAVPEPAGLEVLGLAVAAAACRCRSRGRATS